MNTLSQTLLFIFCVLCNNIYANYVLNAKVVDQQNLPIFSVHVQLTRQLTGTVTNIDGVFKLNLKSKEDSLKLSFLGYKTKYINLKTLNYSKQHIFVLEKANYKIEQVVVNARKSISEEFSIIEMKKLDIYFNPISSGDALKAISILPISTNTNESANLELRGSNSNRSAVVFNGVPIYNPVRNSSLKGMGNFSIFNTELIYNQYVYGGNPPLTLGNSSAGLVEIESSRSLDYESTDLSFALSNLGFMVSRYTNELHSSFIQFYGNYQFSDLFTNINGSSFDKLNSFGYLDFGANYRVIVNKKLSVNLFSYLLMDENYSSVDNSYTVEDVTEANSRRNFNVINFNYLNDNNKLDLNIGTNYTSSNYHFGNIQSDSKLYSVYMSFNHKFIPSSQLSFQYGLSNSYKSQQFENKFPQYYYALSKGAPSFSIDSTISLNNFESYLYSKYRLSKDNIVNLGLRASLSNSSNHLSYQSSFKSFFNKRNSMLISFGRYYNWRQANFYNLNFELLYSNQLSIDYSYVSDIQKVTLAFFYKEEYASSMLYESNRVIDKKVVNGVELYYDLNLFDNFKFSASNTFFNSNIYIDELKFKAYNSIDYFFKFNISYISSFNLNLSYTARPGLNYTPIVEQEFNPNLQVYKPIFSEEINSASYSNYSSLDLSMTRSILAQDYSLVLYLTINNLLNQTNHLSKVYKNDYSNYSYNNYQKRFVYFGVVIKY